MATDLDVTEIIPRLWIGSYPFADGLQEAGFTHIVLCASEQQPGDRAFIGIIPIHCPMPAHGKLSESTEQKLHYAVNAVAGVIRHRPTVKVLAVSRDGRNRAALFAALVLRQLENISGPAAANLVRRKRVAALSRPTLLTYIIQLARAA